MQEYWKKEKCISQITILLLIMLLSKPLSITACINNSTSVLGIVSPCFSTFSNLQQISMQFSCYWKLFTLMFITGSEIKCHPVVREDLSTIFHWRSDLWKWSSYSWPDFFSKLYFFLSDGFHDNLLFSQGKNFSCFNSEK